MRIVATILGCLGLLEPCTASPLIAAASDLKFALDEIVQAFEDDTGGEVRVAYGSSGNFARQIAQGAPFEIFFSADEGFVTKLAREGLTRDGGALYGIGRIVLFARHGSALAPDPKLRNLAMLLERGAVERFAIANPEHAPYGRAARQALAALGLWERLAPRLVLGENVSQAAQFATVGDVTGGIIAYSLALAPDLRHRGTFALIPQELHEPLRQRMVLLENAGAEAERFYAYVQSPRARAVLERYGFQVPESR
jgi:molybdate transport system substrate-binding protein